MVRRTKCTKWVVKIKWTNSFRTFSSNIVIRTSHRCIKLSKMLICNNNNSKCIKIRWCKSTELMNPNSKRCKWIKLCLICLIKKWEMSSSINNNNSTWTWWTNKTKWCSTSSNSTKQNRADQYTSRPRQQTQGPSSISAAWKPTNYFL